MKKHVLRLRARDKGIFEQICSGEKSVETRAATKKYRDVAAGDVLVFVCDGHQIEKEIQKLEHFPSIDALFKEIPLKSVMPDATTLEDAKKVYASFPGYEEKIAKEGIMAFWLS
jgi:ASC-1-like (ASCH) protein